APAPSAGGGAAAAPVSLQQVQAVIEQRCVMCHNAQLAQKGVRLDAEPLIRQHRQQIVQAAAVARTMPLNNATGITDAERELLRRWGAQAQ
ncbi:MAG: hypothetical protein AB1430_04750, partial [Pseudomonadota bacterium]